MSVDIPGGSSVCSPDSTRLLAALPAKLVSMATYSATAPTLADYERYLNDGVAAFGARFVIGLGTLSDESRL
jgi:hypothetical protein